MTRDEAYGPKRHTIPKYTPGKSLVGPDEITGLVREIRYDMNGNVVFRHWDDVMDRWHYSKTPTFDQAIEDACRDNQPITITTTKQRGKWIITEIK